MKTEVPSNYFMDHAGKRFGMVTVIGFDHYKNRRSYWLCKCDCGNEKVLLIQSLVTGGAKSCGCLRLKKIKEAHTARMAKVRLLPKTEKVKVKKWRPLVQRDALDKKLSGLLQTIKQRCYNKNNDSYQWYGARGIGVCEEWLADKWSFIEWAKRNGYRSGLLIDRENVNKGYSPDNCRFVTPLESSRNTRKNLKATINGVEKLFIEWCELLGLRYKTLYARHIQGLGMDPDAAIIAALINPQSVFFENKSTYKAALLSVMKHKDVLFQSVWDSLPFKTQPYGNL